MRIPLEKDQGKQQSRRRRRSRRRTFETEIAQPAMQPRRKARQRTKSPRPSDSPARPLGETQDSTTYPSSTQHAQWRSVLARLPIALLLAGLIAAVLYCSLAGEFFVYGADISGNKYLNWDAVYQASGVHEQNIFWIQPNRTIEAIGNLPGIKTVHVHCALPAHVTIKVVERQPVVLWRAESQQMDWWLDEEGVVLPYGEVFTNTVYVVDSSERQLEVGDRIEPGGIVRSVQRLSTSLPEVNTFYYQKDRGLSFTQTTSYGSWPVYVGNSEDLLRKIQVLRALTEYFVERKMKPAYIDVRWADYPVYGKPGA